MGKRISGLDLALPEKRPGVASYLWLGDALRDAILAGRLKPGAKLPATRDLARQYRLSRGTVVSAFQQLTAEGYIRGRVGSGTYVNRTLPDELLLARRTSLASSRARVQRRRPADVLHVKAFPEIDARPPRAFRANIPALEFFPINLWAQTTARCVRRLSASQLLGCDTAGYRPLREQIAEYLRAARGVSCSYEQVVVVSGAQEALDLVARVLLRRGDSVYVEDPGYIGAIRVCEAIGARIRPLPVDGEGATLPDERHPARFAYVTPAHQCPLGMSLSVPRRLALLDWARRTGAFILEDDYDSEFRYTGRPLPALQSLDTHGVVILAGSFSKVLFPALRLGFLVAPSDLIEPIAALKSVASRHAPVIDQIVLSDFMEAGHFARHIRRMREVYAERLGVLLQSARSTLAGILDVSDVAAGLQTACWLAPGLAADSAAAAAAQRDVVVMPVTGHSPRASANQALVLGFAAHGPEEIRRGVRNLARALEPLRRASTGRLSGAATARSR